MKRNHEDQIMQTTNSLRDLSTRVRKLEKTTRNKSVDKELSTMRHEIDNIVKSMTEGSDIASVPTTTKKQKKKSSKKVVDTDEDEEFQAYLNDLKK